MSKDTTGKYTGTYCHHCGKFSDDPVEQPAQGEPQMYTEEMRRKAKRGEAPLPALVTFDERKGRLAVIVGGFEFTAKDKREAAHRLRHYLLEQLRSLHQYDSEEDAMEFLKVVEQRVDEELAREGMSAEQFYIYKWRDEHANQTIDWPLMSEFAEAYAALKVREAMDSIPATQYAKVIAKLREERDALKARLHLHTHTK